MKANQNIAQFTYVPSPTRVVFGSGTLAHLGEEANRLGCRRALVLSTPEQRGQAEGLFAILQGRSVGIFAGAEMHTPHAVTQAALAVVQERSADSVITLGGGSAVGLGKAIALKSGLPHIAIPTTYAGSEMTPILGETRDGHKTTQRSEKIRPQTVIYDVDLTLSLPIGMSGASGLNAIAHAAEALYAPDGNPIIALMAREGISVIAQALPAIARDPSDSQARGAALYGAWLCGTCLGATSMGLHHKLCHFLGGTFDLPHAQTHAIVLPYALAYNASAAPQAVKWIAQALGTADASGGLIALAQKLGMPRGLRALGMPEEGIARSAELATQGAYTNPRPLDRDALAFLLEKAWAGEPVDAAMERAT